MAENTDRQKFTMLEPVRANNPSPEELATRIVDLAFDNYRFTMLEPVRANNPSPEELATRIVEPLINDGPVCDPVPPAVLSLVAELAKVVDTLDDCGRAAALAHISAKFPKRTAG